MVKTPFGSLYTMEKEKNSLCFLALENVTNVISYKDDTHYNQNIENCIIQLVRREVEAYGEDEQNNCES